MPPVKAEYEVERIICDKYLVGKRFFFVEWRGFGSGYNTWEPEENLSNCPRMIREYFASKGIRNTKSCLSSTLMRCLNVETRRGLPLAFHKTNGKSRSASLEPLKRSPRSSRKSSIASLPADLPNALLPVLVVPKWLGKSDLPVMDWKSLDSQQVTLPPLSSDLSSEATLQCTTLQGATDLLPAKVDLQSERNKLKLEENNNDPPTGSTPNELALPSEMVSSKASEQLDRSPEKLLSGMGLPFMLPNISLVKVDEDSSMPPSALKEAELKRFGLVAVNNLSKSDGPKLRVSKRKRRLTPYARASMTPKKSRDVKRSSRQRFPVVDLTEDSSTGEMSFNSSQDEDFSLQNSQRFPEKLQVRLFDQTPRPEVLSVVPFLETFDSECEATLDSTGGNENESPKKRRGRPKAKTANCKAKTSNLFTVEASAKDLPKTDATVLLMEESAGGSSMVMYFPRLNLVKSVTQNMADKYYSQAVIDYYRRQPVPLRRVSRRSA